METDLNGAVSAPTPQTYDVVFTGSAREYFKIWIVNLFLTLVTFGIYGAWAKVRTRRYFYACTSVAGHPFDYLANPVNILKGHLIVGALFIIYMVTEQFKPEWAFALMIVFYLIFPFLAYNSLKFYTHNSAYRNIRFRFNGTLKQSYILFLLKSLLIPLTLGLYFPFWVFLRKKWFFENAGFGTTTNRFTGRAKQFYKAYFFATLQFLLLAVIPLGMIMGIFAATNLEFSQASLEQPEFLKVIFIFMAIGYATMVLGSVIPQQYLFSQITNHCWNTSNLGRVRVNSRLKTGRLVLIRLTNFLAIIFSLGLMIPWAKVRRTRYVLGCLTVEEAGGGLDEFTAEMARDVSAVGDTAVDFFDFDIGL